MRSSKRTPLTDWARLRFALSGSSRAQSLTANHRIHMELLPRELINPRRKFQVGPRVIEKMGKLQSQDIAHQEGDEQNRLGGVR
jgi:hypothetical protein